LVVIINYNIFFGSLIKQLFCNPEFGCGSFSGKRDTIRPLEGGAEIPPGLPDTETCAIQGAHQHFLAYSAWNTDMANTISSQSYWKENQKRAEKKVKTTIQPPMSEGDMVIRFRSSPQRSCRTPSKRNIDGKIEQKRGQAAHPLKCFIKHCL
jgi:hypothetical protein